MIRTMISTTSAAALMLAPAVAVAQTPPGFSNMQLVSAAQWNAIFAGKADLAAMLAEVARAKAAEQAAQSAAIGASSAAANAVPKGSVGSEPVTANGTTQPVAEWVGTNATNIAANATAAANALGVAQGALTRVANNAGLQFLVTTLPRVYRDGYAVAGDGGAAVYTYSNAPCAAPDGGSQVPAQGGGCWLVDWITQGGVARPELFGGTVSFPVAQEGNALAIDAEPAIQAALNTGRTVRLGSGAYYVRSGSLVKTAGQIIEGAGRWATRVEYGTDFNTATAPALFKTVNGAGGIASGNEGPIFRDFQIKGYQPEVNPAQTTAQQIATLIPISGIDVRDTIASQFHNMFISTGLRGIDMRGNTGQTVIDDVQGSNFVSDVDIDGALDTVRINNLHSFPLALTANQAALAQANACSIRSGRMDDLKISNSMAISPHTALCFQVGTARTPANDGYTSPGGITTASLTNHDFDTVPLGIQQDGGSTILVGGYFASKQHILLNGGSMTVTGTSMPVNADQEIVVNSGAYLTFTGTTIGDPGTDFNFLTQNGGGVSFVGNFYNYAGYGNTTKPKINSICCRFIAEGNIALDRGSGTQGAAATFFTVAQDGYNRVTGNLTPGWANSFPVNSTYGQYAGTGVGTFGMPGGFDVTGYPGSIGLQGQGNGCHFVYDTGNNVGNLTCVQPGVAWRPLNFDADVLTFGGVNVGMSVVFKGSRGVSITNGLSAGSYTVGSTAGVSCSGAPTSSYAVTNGIVTHC